MRLEAVSFFVCSCLQASVNLIQAVIASGFHLFPFRTEKLSPSAPMVLHTRGRVGRRRLFRKGSPSVRLDWRASSFMWIRGVGLLTFFVPSVASAPLRDVERSRKYFRADSLK